MCVWEKLGKGIEHNESMLDLLTRAFVVIHLDWAISQFD